MSEPNEYNSIDALFKKAFDDVSNTPAADGWDTPSGKVWEHVRNRIEAPRHGWSTRTLGLIAAFSVTVLIGLYLTLTQTQAVEKTPNSAPISTPGAVSAPLSAPEKSKEIEIPLPETIKAAKPGSKSLKQEQKVQNPLADKEENHTAEHRPAALPLPGSRPLSPNSTVARQQQIWLMPMPFLPAARSLNTTPPAPERLKVKQ